MKFFNFKTKIIFLSVVPILIIGVVLTLLSAFYSRQLWERNTEEFGKKIYELRRQELKHYTQLATAAINHAYRHSSMDNEGAQQMALQVLRDLKYGDNGYFFVYDYDGKNLVHAPKPHLEGRHLIGLRDSDGQYVIQSLIRQAKNDLGGYSEYLWEKPSTGRETDKLSYSAGLSKWRWMIGTGLYVDDIEQTITSVKQSVADNTRRIVLMTAGLSLLVTAIVAFVAFRFTISQRRLASRKLQKLSRVCVEEREHERGRVAKLLNTEIISSIKYIRDRLSALKNMPQCQDALIQEKLIQMHSAVGKTHRGIAQIANDLRPDILVQEGLCAAVDKLADCLSKKRDIKISVSTVDLLERPPLNTELTCYHITQQAIYNIVLHSQATEASIRIRQSHSLLSITIQDNGIGFKPDEMMAVKEESGVGLAGMQLRTEMLNGLFTLFSAPGTGTIIKIAVPLS